MKKSKILKAILSPVIKGLAIFAIFGLAVYVYASLDWPDDQPNPVTGVVGQFIGITETKFTIPQDYETANNYCKTGNVVTPTGPLTDTDSHICSPMELISSYNHSNSAVKTQTGVALVNNGPPGYTSFSNDCLGWSNTTGNYGGLPVYGAIWDFTKKFGKLSNCGDIVATSNYSFACCK